MNEALTNYTIYEDEIISNYTESFDELNEENRDYYISEILDYLSIYLYKGPVSVKSEDIINLFDLTEDELITLKSVHFLLSPEIKRLFRNMPHLLRNLAHSTNKEDIEYRGIIRGSINWNKTIKTRISQGYNDSSLFVCSPPLKHYDLDENRLLKFLLKEIVSLFEESLDFINSKESNLDYSKLDDEKGSWYDSVDYVYQQSIETLRNVYLNGVGDVDFISSYALEKALTQRNPLYHDVARAYELYEKLFILDDLDSLEELIKNQIIVVSNNDTLYELYIFAKMIDVLENISMNNSFKIELYYKGHNKPVVGKLDNGNTVRIWYQNVPQTFTDNSYYIAMTKNQEYGFRTSVRRPDMIVEIIKDGVSFFRIIEVKNASGGNYIRNSFYKVLGYYRDFQGVNFTKNIPFVLVNWLGSEINKDYEEMVFERDIIIFNKNEFIENISILFDL